MRNKTLLRKIADGLFNENFHRLAKILAYLLSLR